MQEAWHEAGESAVLARAGLFRRVAIDARSPLGQRLRNMKGRTCPDR